MYDAPGEGVFEVDRHGDSLTITAPEEWGLPRLRLRPESRQSFFVLELPLRVSFEQDASGRITRMLVYPPRGQKAVPADKKNSVK